MLSDRPLLRNVAEQCLDRSERVVVVRERASAKLSDRKLVREHVAEERCPGTSREVLVQLPEMRHEQLRDDDERTHLQLVWQHGYSRTARRPDSARKPREAGGVVAKMLVYRGESLILEFVQRGPDGAIPRGARMAFREPGCPNARNLGLDQDANTSDNCAIQQVVWHVMIGHSAQFTPGSARHCRYILRVHESDCIVGDFGARQHRHPRRPYGLLPLSSGGCSTWTCRWADYWPNIGGVTIFLRLRADRWA